MKCEIKIYKTGDIVTKTLSFDTIREGRKKLAYIKKVCKMGKKYGDMPYDLIDRIIDLRVNGIAIDGISNY